MSDPATRANALDHVVVVLFENRSLDNVLGHLYGPEDGKTFEGVIGKDLSNPRKVAPLSRRTRERRMNHPGDSDCHAGVGFHSERIVGRVEGRTEPMVGRCSLIDATVTTMTRVEVDVMTELEQRLPQAIQRQRLIRHSFPLAAQQGAVTL
jgi:hypothetical protein